MIRWCSYCQKMLGEFPPLIDYRVSHGLCERCSQRLLAGEELSTEHRLAIRFYRKLYAAASEGDPSTCGGLVREGSDLFGAKELLIGMLQPALVEIGAGWEHGKVSVVEEHRFSAWCQAMLAELPRKRRAAPPRDLVIFLAPGNSHDLGPRVAEYVLNAQGVNCELITPDLPTGELIDWVIAERPRWVGLSCAMPESLSAAVQVAGELRRRDHAGGIMLSGQALRREPQLAAELPSDVVTCLTLEEARAALQQG